MVDGSLDKEARLWGMLCHLAALSGYVVPFGGHIVGPLVVWLIKKEEIPFVDEQGKESLNFQISMMIYLLVCIPFVFIIIGVFMIAAVLLADFILTILAGIKANNGEHYRYPLTIRFIK